ncbi:MAG: M48 family metallopeptidase [Methylococcaceae bacterium]|nr:M48 family metallopeptidase [Methylococcaceae bacterium]
MQPLKHLTGYPVAITEEIQQLINRGELGALLLKKHPVPHNIKTDKALYAYGITLKNTFLRQSQPISKIVYDDKIQAVQHALGTHSFISRIQGGQLKAKNEIKVASIFKQVPQAFLTMILVHELAHLKEKAHNKAFYQLCTYMQPAYHHYELELRVYLTYVDLFGKLY